MYKLTANDLERYSRQIIYPGFGEEGQLKLKEAHVVVTGLGGLGSAATLYLAATGMGHITLIDHDRVELANLNRQILHWDEDIGTKKPLSAAGKIAKLNPSITVTPIVEKINHENASDLVRGASVVIDGMDNFEGRLAVNAACVAERIPFIHAGIHGFLGEVTTIIPGQTFCLACIFPQPPKKRPTIPVFGVNPGLMACLQVTEAIKLLAGFGDPLTGKMLYVNSETVEFNIVDVPRRSDCEVCSQIET